MTQHLQKAATRVGRCGATVLASLLLFAPLTCSATDASTGEQIEHLERDWNDAYGANDLPKYFSYYADDPILVFYNERTTLPAYRKMWTETTKTEPLESAKISDLKVRVDASGDTAIASYQIDVRTRHADGKTTLEHAFETDVWFRQKGAWRVSVVHYSATAAK
jgi:ketosteroid isomerase-like protein